VTGYSSHFFLHEARHTEFDGGVNPRGSERAETTYTSTMARSHPSDATPRSWKDHRVHGGPPHVCGGRKMMRPRCTGSLRRLSPWALILIPLLVMPEVWTQTKGDRLMPEKKTSVTHVQGQAVQGLKGGDTKQPAANRHSPSGKSRGVKKAGIVCVSVGNLRSRPTDLAELTTQALLGTPLTVLAMSGRWYYVQTPDDYRGWMDNGFVVMDRERFLEWVEKPKIIVTTEFGFTFASEDGTAGVVSDVVIGALLALKSEGAAFYQVEYPDGRAAFLPRGSGEHFDKWLNEAQDTPERIVATAYRFMGIPYLWGGTSAKGFDCSGFTKTVFFLNGIVLPRDASQQALVGEPVKAENLKAGDLVFFGSKSTRGRKERVKHVGIYLDTGRFINASGDVRINSLNPSDSTYVPRRAKTLLGARRVIGVGTHAGVRRLREFPLYRTNGL
jgi:gamma-D-glutamyl-L-lysine dipeptidyl-peptidase